MFIVLRSIIPFSVIEADGDGVDYNEHACPNEADDATAVDHLEGTEDGNLGVLVVRRTGAEFPRGFENGKEGREYNIRLTNGEELDVRVKLAEPIVLGQGEEDGGPR